MRCVVTDERVLFAKCIVKMVSQTLKKSLQVDFPYTSKINKLQVIINFRSGDTSGSYCVDKTKKPYNILLYVNPENSYKFIAYIIAHEFAHYIFSGPSYHYYYAGAANDNSFMVTAVQRFLPEIDEVYGLGLEELLADYIALYTVNKLKLEDTNGDFSRIFEQEKGNYEIVRELEIQYGDAILDESFKRSSRYICDYKSGPNYMWYSILANAMDNIVDDFDTSFGGDEKSFYNFCLMIDNYWYEELPKEKEIEKEEIMLYLFSKKQVR